MKYLQNIRIDANLYQFIEYSFVESQKLQYRLHSYVSIIPIISLIQTLKNRGRIYFQNFRSIAIINSLPPPPSLHPSPPHVPPPFLERHEMLKHRSIKYKRTMDVEA